MDRVNFDVYMHLLVVVRQGDKRRVAQDCTWRRSVPDGGYTWNNSGRCRNSVDKNEDPGGLHV